MRSLGLVHLARLADCQHRTPELPAVPFARCSELAIEANGWRFAIVPLNANPSRRGSSSWSHKIPVGLGALVQLLGGLLAASNKPVGLILNTKSAAVREVEGILAMSNTTPLIPSEVLVRFANPRATEEFPFCDRDRGIGSRGDTKACKG